MNYIDPIYDWANEGSPEVAEVYPKPELVLKTLSLEEQAALWKDIKQHEQERLWKLVVETSRG